MENYDIHSEHYERLGGRVKAKLDEHMKERVGAETQWLVNLRQYRGVYDKYISARIAKDKSSAYPRDTRLKVKGFVAKMMEMMFPATEVNWKLSLTPIPSIPTEDINALITRMEAEELVTAAAEQRPPLPLRGDDIEREVVILAEDRRDKMQKEILDQLMDPGVDWPCIAKRVVRSGAIYGAGFVKSPLVRKQNERTWELSNGKYEAKTILESRPYPEFVKVWDIYPDMNAPTWEEQDGLFERMVLSREGFRRLQKRPGFIKEAIDEYLINNQSGNYIYRTFESELRELSTSSGTTVSKDEKRYEVFRYYGYWSAHELSEMGVEIPEDKLGTNVLSDIWMIDNNVIYADLAPFGIRVSDVYHTYIYTEDEEAGLTGVGMPEELRDRQMAICSATRALYDNMAAAAGPMTEVAVDALKPNTNTSIHSFAVFEREGEGAELQHPAIRNVTIDSHITEMLAILAGEREQFDLESNLPAWTLGSAQPLGEAFRTTSNMSQMTGGANMVTKDHVRAFDKLTTSVVNSMLGWNMEFNKNESIKGDYQVRATGTISLVAKEVRGQALDQFVTTLSEEERVILRERPTLIERMKARDLPIDLVYDEEEAERKLAEYRQRQQEAVKIETDNKQAQTGKLQADATRTNTNAQIDVAKVDGDIREQQARIAEILGRIRAMQADAKDKETQRELEMLEISFEGILASLGGSDDTARAGGDGPA